MPWFSQIRRIPPYLIVLFVIFTALFLIPHIRPHAQPHAQPHTQTLLEGFDISGPSNLNRVSIWKHVRAKRGLETAQRIMPRSFLLPDELHDLLDDPHPQFILKTFRGAKGIIGQRSGVALYDNKEAIQKDHGQYVIGQVFIPNPYLVHGHKFDVRFFVVVHCGYGGFLYKPGYCVYARDPFEYEGLNRNRKINQVHTDESHYDDNDLPRLFSDFCSIYEPRNTTLIHNRLVRNLSIILDSVEAMCTADNRDFHIYGVDVELTDTLEPLIIEINQTPALRFGVPWKERLIKPLLKDVRRARYTSDNWVSLRQ